MKEKCKLNNWGYSILIGCLMALLVGFVVFSFWGCGLTGNEKPKKETKDSTEKIIYYCPMHPEIKQDHPGKCPRPECNGMELVAKMSKEMTNVLKPVNASVLASVKTTKPVFQKMPMDVETNGYIDYDDRAKNNISSLVSGRIEKLYIKYNYQPIHIGEKVFEIYSPELVSAQENLIYVLNNDAEEKMLVESAKQKLKLLGFSDNLLSELLKTKKVMHAVPVYSNYEGHIHQMKEMNPSFELNSMPSAEKQNYQSDKELSVKEGQYIMMGETVFNVVNHENIAVILQIKAEDIAKVNKGAEVEINMEGGMIMNGKIDFIEPMLKPGAKTIMAKIFFQNHTHNHKVGSLVKVIIKGKELESLWIPLSTVLDLGTKKIVWTKKDGNFIAKKVETAIRSGNMIEVAGGLTESDEIAIEAHYLTDSEGFIKTK